MTAPAKATAELPPLLEGCSECDGNGWVQEGRRKKWQEEVWEDDHSAEPPQELIDEKVPEEVPCIECEGHGKRPTEAGLQIMELVHVCQTSFPPRP